MPARLPCHPRDIQLVPTPPYPTLTPFPTLTSPSLLHTLAHYLVFNVMLLALCTYRPHALLPAFKPSHSPLYILLFAPSLVTAGASTAADPGTAHGQGVPLLQQNAQPAVAEQASSKLDEAVLAELPQQLQREIRGEMKMRQLAAHLDGRKQQQHHRYSGCGGGRSGGGSGSGKRSGGSAGVAGGKQQDILTFIKGKRVKH